MMNRRAFLRVFGGALTTLAVVPQALLERSVYPVTPAPIVAPILSDAAKRWSQRLVD